ncbi:hypothetical protein BDD12DRAFT_807181 [Trichophaea hybrida]|nr:hypothetical protein BDD12DRAFT_807181 [Trichophaea hybrida]
MTVSVASLIITAANDLVAGKAPIGLVLFAYSIPSILTRIIVPLVRFPDMYSSKFQTISLFTRRGGSGLDGGVIREPTSLTKEINYPLRLVICTVSSFFGLQMLALFDKIGVLVLGVMLAALSSNLGDITFAIVSLAPIVALLAYVFILPDPEGEAPRTTDEVKEGIVRLPWRDKLRIIEPMFVPYMLPLASIFFIENSIAQLTVNQLSSFGGRFSFWFFRLPGGQTRSTKAYWMLVMIEGSAFLLQLANSSNMTSNIESSPDDPEKAVLYGPMGVVILAGVQGLMAGIVFCNTYWKVMNNPLPPAVYDALDEAKERNGLRDTAYSGGVESREGLLDGTTNVADNGGEGIRNQSQETALREFLLSTIAPPDVISVTIASLFGMALQQSLCCWQRANGRELCMHASK